MIWLIIFQIYSIVSTEQPESVTQFKSRGWSRNLPEQQRTTSVRHAVQGHCNKFWFVSVAKEGNRFAPSLSHFTIPDSERDAKKRWRLRRWSCRGGALVLERDGCRRGGGTWSRHLRIQFSVLRRLSWPIPVPIKSMSEL